MNYERFKKEYALKIPEQAGVYRYFDNAGKILYVGKAKNLKKRVSSYFTKQNHQARIKLLIKKTDQIVVTVVKNEHDALLLENNLIKSLQPKYNVMLKDGKTYPFICIKNEAFPRVYLTRTRQDKGAIYLGPYTSITRVRAIMDFIKLLYPLRSCNYNLSPGNIKKGKFKICLEYHIGNCKGPCEGFQSEAEYLSKLEEIKDILNGKVHTVIQSLKAQIKTAAGQYAFEEANRLKKQLEHLQKYQSKSIIVSPRLGALDVFAMKDNEHVAYVHYFKIVNGTIISDQSISLIRKLEEKKERLLAMAIIEMRQRFHSTAKEIIVPFDPDIQLTDAKISIPQKGNKKKLLELCYKNALQYEISKTKRIEKFKQKRSRQEILEQLQKDFRMNILPACIECFDNSNIQGQFPVASMVRFSNAKPDKKNYRHYNIKTVTGANDFASMEEIVYRRYKRLLDEGKTLPSLILIDGGKGQLNAAIKSLKKLNLDGKITIASIAKKLEEIYFPNDPIPLHINKTSYSLKLLQQIRDEAHRFAITFHRQKRDKATLSTDLENIPGIGPKTAQLLLQHYRSVKKIRQTENMQIAKLIGPAKAEKLKAYYHKN